MLTVCVAAPHCQEAGAVCWPPRSNYGVSVEQQHTHNCPAACPGGPEERASSCAQHTSSARTLASLFGSNCTPAQRMCYAVILVGLLYACIGRQGSASMKAIASLILQKRVGMRRGWSFELNPGLTWDDVSIETKLRLQTLHLEAVRGFAIFCHMRGSAVQCRRCN